MRDAPAQQTDVRRQARLGLRDRRGPDGRVGVGLLVLPGPAQGLGPALNNKPLPAFLIRTQTRLGVGAMPAFPESALSAGDLDAVARYIRFLRSEVEPPPG